MRAAGVLGIGICAVVVGVMACSGDTFTNEPPGGGGDGGPGVDAGGDAGGDGGRPSCAPGASERAFCSNFDKSTDVRDDKWSVGGAGQAVHVRGASSFNATTSPNYLFVESGSEDRAFVTTTLPTTKRFKLAFDLRAQERGNQSYVPMRLSFCGRSGGTCFAMQLRFSPESDGRQIYLEDRTTFQTSVGDTDVIDGKWTRVTVESNLEATAQGIANVRVSFGQAQPTSALVRVPADTMAQLDRVELSLGAVEAETGSGGFNAYQLAFDTVVFEPAP